MPNRHHSRGALLVVAALLAVTAAGCARSASRPAVQSIGADVPADTLAARRVFEENIASIHARDRARYLATYLQTEGLIRNGPGGVELGFADWPARRDTTWPDTLIARDLRLMPLAPGVVYGTYHYRVTQGGNTTEGISERVFVETPEGWRIAVTTAFGLPEGAAPPPLALVGGTLINPGSAPIRDAVVLVQGGRIACAGTRRDCPVPPTAETVDVRGKFVGPGLIDAHVHYSQTGWLDGRPDAGDVRDRFPYDSTIGALRANPDRFHRAQLCAGVTSVFDVGGYTWTYDVARESRGALDAPRVVAAGPLLSTRDHWVNLPTMRQFIPMTGDSVVRAMVRAQAALGAEAIKVWYLQLPDTAMARARPLLMAAGEEARRVGLPLIVHSTQLRTAKDAVAAGARVLVHSVEAQDVDEEFVEAARRAGTILIPTLTVYEGYADVRAGRSPAARYPLDCVDPATRAKLETRLPSAREVPPSPAAEQRRQRMARNLMRLHQAGVPIAMGTDAGNPGTAHGPSVYREMEAMQEAGMSAGDVFASSTLVAARALGIADETGSIEDGKRADIVVFGADPTADAANARRVELVVRNGALYDRRELLPR